MNTHDWIEVLGFAFGAGVTVATWEFHDWQTRKEIRALKERVQNLEFCLGADTLAAARSAFRQRDVLEKIAEMVGSLLRKKRG